VRNGYNFLPIESKIIIIIKTRKHPQRLTGPVDYISLIIKQLRRFIARSPEGSSLIFIGMYCIDILDIYYDGETVLYGRRIV